MSRMITVILLLVCSTALLYSGEKKKKDKPDPACLPQPIMSTVPRLPKGFHRNVMFSLDVDDQGQVSNVKLTQSSGDRKLDQDLLEKVKAMKFKERAGCGTFHVPLNLGPDI